MLYVIFILFISVPCVLFGYGIGNKRRLYNEVDQLKQKISILREQNAGTLNIIENRLSREKKEMIKPIIDMLR